MESSVDKTFSEMVWWYTFPDTTGSAAVYIPKDMTVDEFNLFMEALHGSFERVEDELRNEYECVD